VAADRCRSKIMLLNSLTEFNPKRPTFFKAANLLGSIISQNVYKNQIIFIEFGHIAPSADRIHH
jgi:hypothetical protein